MDGKTKWYFPDGEIPPMGDDPEVYGHESLILIKSLDDAGGGHIAGGEDLLEKVGAYGQTLVAAAKGRPGAEHQTAGAVADHRICLGDLGYKA